MTVGQKMTVGQRTCFVDAEKNIYARIQGIQGTGVSKENFFFLKLEGLGGICKGGAISGYRVQCFVEKRLPSRLSSESDTDNSG